jgi:hypothetical protein
MAPKWLDATAVGGRSFMIHVRNAAAAIAAGRCESALITKPRRITNLETTGLPSTPPCMCSATASDLGNNAVVLAPNVTRFQSLETPLSRPITTLQDTTPMVRFGHKHLSLYSA